MAGLSLSIGNDLIFTKVQIYISQSVFDLCSSNKSRMSNVSVSRSLAHKHLISSAATPDQQYVLSTLLFSCLHSPVRPPLQPAPNEQDPRRRSASALSPRLSLLCLTFTDTRRQIYFTLCPSLTVPTKEDFCCVTASRHSISPALSGLLARTLTRLSRSHLCFSSPGGLNVTFC